MRWNSRIAPCLLAALPVVAVAQKPASWVNVGPPGGDSYIAADPVDPSHVVVLDGAGQLHETHDRGTTWKAGAGRACQATDLALRGGSAFVACLSQPPLRSDDGGASWQALVVTAPTLNYRARTLLLDPSSKITVAPAQAPANILFRSPDDGSSWNEIFLDTIFNSSAFAFDPASPGRMVSIGNLGSRTVAYESRNGGASWAEISTLPGTPSGAGCFANGIASYGAVAYALTDCGPFISGDSGRTWKALDAATFAGATAFRIDPSRPSHALASAPGKVLLETLDGGQSWAQTTTPAGPPVAVQFGADGSAWAAAGGSIYRRDATGSAWTAVATSALRGSVPLALAAGGANGLSIFSHDAVSRDGGATWSAGGGVTTPVLGEPSQFYRIGLASAQRSDDGGATWIAVPFATKSPTGKDLAGFTFAGRQPGVAYAVGTVVSSCLVGVCSSTPVELLRSSDGGASWVVIDASLPPGFRSNPMTTAADPRVVYVATTTALYRSSDGGSSWVKVRAAGSGAWPDQRDAATAYVVGEDKIFRTADGGVTWTGYDAPDARMGLSAFLVDPLDAGRAYLVGKDGAAFETRDRGTSWRPLALGETNVVTPYGNAAIVVSGTQRTLLRLANNSIFALRSDDNTLALGADLWWNPAENGTGFSIIQRASGQVFMVWYHYDRRGKPTWSFVSGGTWSDARTFSGTLAVTKASGFFTGFDPKSVTTRAIGKATLRFSDANNADLSIAFDDGSPAFERKISRLFYRPTGQGLHSDVSGLWWNPAQSGWGVSIGQQGYIPFLAWFLYDDAGDPTWLYAPSLASAVGQADLLATSGPPFPGPYDPAKVTITKVGTVSLAEGAPAWLRYDLGTGARYLPLEQLPF